MIDIENMVLSKLIDKIPSAIKTKYPNLNFTTSDISNTNPSFPNVYVHLMDFPQIGQSLDNKVFGGGTAVFQIEVEDNKSQSNARKVMNAVIDILNGQCGFEVMYGPTNINKDTTYRQVARLQRVVMSNEKL